jgi:electron transfer flavoprotein alpha/beta subunit
VVATVAPDSNKPRYAAAGAIMRVYEQAGAVEAVTASELGMTEDDLTPRAVVRGEAFPAERTLGRRLEGTVDEMARALVALGVNGSNSGSMDNEWDAGGKGGGR